MKNLKAGQSVNLSANFSGTPQPNITWFTNNSILEIDENINIEIKDSVTNLSFKNLTGNHSGKLGVMAENIVGKEEIDIEISVKGK